MPSRGPPPAPQNHAQTRSPPPRPRNSSSGRHLPPHAQRRLPLAHERSRPHAARNPPPLPHRRRSLRRIFQNDDPHVPLREAHPLHGPARSHHAAPARPPAPLFSRPAFSPAFFRRALHPRPTHHHERPRLSQPMFPDQLPQIHHVLLPTHRN